LVHLAVVEHFWEFVLAVVHLLTLVGVALVLIVVHWDIEVFLELLASTLVLITIDNNLGVAFNLLLRAGINLNNIVARLNTFDVVLDIVEAVSTLHDWLFIAHVWVNTKHLQKLVAVTRVWHVVNENLSVAAELLVSAAVIVFLVLALGNTFDEATNKLHAVTLGVHSLAVWQVEVLLSLVAVLEVVLVLANVDADAALLGVLLASVESHVVLTASDIVDVRRKVFLAVTTLLNVDTFTAHDGLERRAVHSVHLFVSGGEEVNVALLLEGAVVEAHVHLAVLHEGFLAAIDLLANAAVIVFHLNVEFVHELLALHALWAVGAREVNEAGTLHRAWLEAGGNFAVVLVHVLGAVVVDFALHLAVLFNVEAVKELLAVHTVELILVHELNDARLVGVAIALGLALGVHAVLKTGLLSAVNGLEAGAVAGIVVTSHIIKHFLELITRVGELHIVVAPVVLAVLDIIASVVAEPVSALLSESVLLSAVTWCVAVGHHVAIVNDWAIEPHPELVTRSVLHLLAH
jgi:hypothetical protein